MHFHDMHKILVIAAIATAVSAVIIASRSGSSINITPGHQEIYHQPVILRPTLTLSVPHYTK